MEGSPNLAKLVRRRLFPRSLNLADEVVDGPGSSAVLQGLDGGEKTQVEDVGVGAVGRLVGDYMISNSSEEHSSGTLLQQLFIFVHTVRACVVLLGVNGEVPGPSRPFLPDGGDGVVDKLLLVRNLGHLQGPRYDGPGSTVSATALRGDPFDEEPDTDLAVVVAVRIGIPTGASHGREEYDLRDVAFAFVLDLADGGVLAVVEVVSLPFLEEANPLLIDMNEVLEVTKPPRPVGSLRHPSDRTFLCGQSIRLERALLLRAVARTYSTASILSSSSSRSSPQLFVVAVL